MSLSEYIQVIVLVLALSTDAFAASLAYGAEGIKIPKKSAVLINLICSSLFGAGLLIGKTAENFIPQRITSYLSFFILFLLAFIKFFDFSIKRWIKKSNNYPRKDFYFLNFHFLLEVICDSTQADADLSKYLSLKEAYALAVALSLDGFTAGIGAGLSCFNVFSAVLLSFMFGMAAVLLGDFSGERISKRNGMDFSWIGGIILLILAFLRI